MVAPLPIASRIKRIYAVLPVISAKPLIDVALENRIPGGSHTSFGQMIFETDYFRVADNPPGTRTNGSSMSIGLYTSIHSRFRDIAPFTPSETAMMRAAGPGRGVDTLRHSVIVVWVIDPEDGSFSRYEDSQLNRREFFSDPARGINFDMNVIKGLLTRTSRS